MQRHPVAEYLMRENLGVSLTDLWVEPRQRLSSLCYLQTADSILMLKRNKPPFAGYWTAPGGKLLPGEDPVEGIVREVEEETALRLEAPQLRFIASEVGAEPELCWLLFGFVAYAWQGELGTTSEGELAWIPLAELDECRIPDVDRALLPHVLESPQGQVYVAHIEFGRGGSVSALQIDRVTRQGR